MQNNKTTFLFEAAWEACNKLGGIYTVIRSKAPAATKRYGANYAVVGPYFADKAEAEFEHVELPDSPIGKAVKYMWDLGLEVHYGTWLISGRPTAILFNPNSIKHQLNEIKGKISNNYGINLDYADELFDDVVAFGELTDVFFKKVAEYQEWEKQDMIIHYHEWMAVSHLSELKNANLPYKVIFTTHATILGRYLAMNDSGFYQHLPFYDWHKEASHFNILPQVSFERIAAQNCDILTTVSSITGRECTHLLGRTPDSILPNGLNIERFKATHKIETLHTESKEKIHRFTMGHFFHNYSFDLSKTIYLFTSGRYEYKNKGYDLTLEAMARLNHMLKESGSDKTVVLFIISKRPQHSINPDVLQSRGVMEELSKGVDSIANDIKKKLFIEAASNPENPKLPELNDLVDDYWKLRYRRALNTWKSDRLPPVVTHNLVDDSDDEVLDFLRTSDLINKKEDRVKIIYHPDFISESNPLFGMDYDQFIRGCHLGVFPSYYEPWGYTPLEALASAIPALTSNLAGFGDYVFNETNGSKDDGIQVIDRIFKSYHESADQMAEMLYDFVSSTPFDRINQRNRAERFSDHFDWEKLFSYYERAYNLATEKTHKK
ncbi:MAG: glycosyltransferase [Ichthyobacteriaceae bacterium]|nr:glycosyltransferase [Ichthyobacteriaceae bacterium]